MKQLAIEGECTYDLGPSQVTFRVGRIANNRNSGVSNSLCLRLYALESSSSASIRGHVVAEAKLEALAAGDEKFGFEATVPIQPVPSGSFYPAITLAESSSISPNGWAIFDIRRFDEPMLFGKSVNLVGTAFNVSNDIFNVNIQEIRNMTQETTGLLRITLLSTKEPHESGLLKGTKIGWADIGALESGQSHRQLQWEFERPGNTLDNALALLFLEEKVGTNWLVRDYTNAAIDVMPDGSVQTAVPDPDDDPMQELEALVGLAEVKEELRELDAWAWRQRQLRDRGREEEEPRSLHMCFSGNPGTGKTTVARIVGRFLAKSGLLPHGRFKEVGRVDLVAEYLGQTAHNTQKVIDEALGGVLFIDEAYALSDPTASGSGQDYGREAMNTLITAMENNRDELCVIVAGYTADMENFLSANSGMRSRIGRTIEFPDFSEDELWEIFERMLVKTDMNWDPAIVPEFKAYMRRLKSSLQPKQFGNARSVRNVVERATQKLAVRLRESNNPHPTYEELKSLKLSDFSFFSKQPDDPEIPEIDTDRILLQKLQERLEDEIADKNIDPERATELIEIVDEFRRRGLNSDTNSRSGFGTIEQLRNDIVNLTQQRSLIRELTKGQLESTKDPSYGLPRPPQDSRAEFLRTHLWPLKKAVLEIILEGGLQRADLSEAMELARQCSDLDRRLHFIGGNNQDALEFEASQLRKTAERIRTFTARKHLFFAKPIWGNLNLGWSANVAYFAGRAAIKRLLSDYCIGIRMRLAESPPAMEAAAGNFAQLVHANVCVFDMAEAAGRAQAAVSYSLGIAWTLGKPIVILTEPGLQLPFDVDLPAVSIGTSDTERKEAFEKALGQACYQVHSSVPTASVNTFIDDAVARYGSRRQTAVIDQTLNLLESQRAKPDWLMVAENARQLTRYNGEENPPLLLHPHYPIDFRESGRKRLFHVMPFSRPWSNDVMHTVEAACGQSVGYIRGDRVIEPKIINSIWDEICQATHVVVDLTDFNSNVALELGIAHCMGKPVMVTGQNGTEHQLFDEIAKLRIHPYSLKNFPALVRAVSDFVS